MSHWSKHVVVASWDAPSSGSLISTKPSDSHMAPGWSFGELSVLSSTPSTVVSCTAYIYFGRGGGSLLDTVLVHGSFVCLLFFVKRLCVAVPTVCSNTFLPLPVYVLYHFPLTPRAPAHRSTSTFCLVVPFPITALPKLRYC